MVAVLERAEAEKSDGLPTLAEVPQMLAAGWGGIGSSGRRHACLAPEGYGMSPGDSLEYISDYQAGVPPPIVRAGRRHASIDAGAQAFDPDSQISFSRHFGSSAALTSRNLFAPTMYHLLGALQDWGMYESIGDFILLLEDPSRFKIKAMIELPKEIHEWLEVLAKSRQDMVIDEARKIVILAFLACLLDLVAADKEKPEMQKYFRSLRQALKREIQLNPVPMGLHIQIADWLKTKTMREWCFPGSSVS